MFVWLFNIAVSITEVAEVLRDVYSLIPTDVWDKSELWKGDRTRFPWNVQNHA